MMTIRTAPMLDTDGWPIDPKGDAGLQQALKFYVRGQTAYGEWFKRLGSKDRPPRGSCTRFFEAHKHHRSFGYAQNQKR